MEYIKYLSTVDLTSSYWQVSHRPHDRKFTGFLFLVRTYFNVVLFGLPAAVAVAVTHCMDQVLGPEVMAVTIPYINGLLVILASLEQHLDHLQRLSDRLEAAGMTINFVKCIFLRDEVFFLGHVISPQGVKVDPEQVKAIQKFPAPQNVRQLRAFLWSFKYDRRFCNNYAYLVKPLIRLRLFDGKDFSWHWAPAESTGFGQIKTCFLHCTIIRHLHLNQKFYI